MYGSILVYMLYCWLILVVVRLSFYICSEKLEVCNKSKDKNFKVDMDVTLTLLIAVNSIFIKCMLSDFSFADSEVERVGIVMAINYITPAWEILNCILIGIRGKQLLITSAILTIGTLGWLIVATSII